jgi:hypothetical protein
MKKFLFGTAGLLLIAASCSKNEVVEVNQDGNEIQFSVVANNATKAADIYCNNNKPSEFTVYAKSDGKTYIDGDKITSTDGNNWVNESGTRFWPNESTVDFYAVVNGIIDWNPTAETSPASIDYTVDTDVEQQKDLLYAVKTGQKRGETAEKTKAVTLNFRHALSQIVFQAKNTNPNLYVEVSGVSIVNVGNTNTFAFPNANTDNNMEDTDHDGSFDHTINYSDGSWGKWNDLTSGSTVYPVDFETVKVKGTNTVVDLTANVMGDNTVKDEFNKNALLLLPQTSTVWNPETVPTPGVDGNASNGSYFLVNCAIYNVAGDEFDAEDDTPLWGTTDAHKQAAIPVAINWEQGKKYIYTFIFGEGGGYDPNPDPDPDPDDPDPVLIPITFEVTVDDFVEVPAQDIDMDVL